MLNRDECLGKIDKKLPEKFYRYCSARENYDCDSHCRLKSEDKLNRDFENLKNHTISLSDPEDFNDPLDCAAQLFRRYPEKFNNLDKFAELMKIANKIVPEKFGYAFLDEYKNLNTLYSGFKGILNWLCEFKVYCVSEKNDSHLMWAHYANGMRGFCIEFNSTAKFLSLSCRSPVYYREVTPTVDALMTILSEMSTLSSLKKTLEKQQRVDDLDMLNASNENYTRKLIVNAFAIKLSHWEYEHEWRIMQHKAKGNAEKIVYDSKDVTGIIVGERMIKDDKGKSHNEQKIPKLKKIIEAIYPHIKQLQVAKIDSDKVIIDHFPLDIF